MTGKSYEKEGKPNAKLSIEEYELIECPKDHQMIRYCIIRADKTPALG